MKPAQGLHTARPCHYVQHLTLRHAGSPAVYRSILNQFHGFVTQRIKDGGVSEKVVREWLKARLRVQPFHSVVRRARLVDRYLDWVVQTGKLLENPLAKLKTKYGLRTTTPIVRALLSSNPKAALETLRPAPRFGSFLGPLMREHIVLMRALGYRYNVHERYMWRLDRFLQDRSDLAGQPLTRIIYEWTQINRSPEHALHCQKIGRALSKALARIDSSHKSIAWDGRIEREARRHHRRPYMFSESDIHCILQAALNFPSPHSPLRPQTTYTMLVLAYCAGLRLGEIVCLNLGDVDLETRTIHVRETKFFKVRRLPLSNSAADTLSNYLDVRRKAGAPLDPASGLFWHGRGAGRYSYRTTAILLMRVLRHSGIKPKQGRIGPHIHDLRHAFAVHRMLQWYREGINPEPYLPYLATYMGHRNIHSTLVYLTVTPELLQQAGEKYRQLGALVLSKTAGGEQ